MMGSGCALHRHDYLVPLEPWRLRPAARGGRPDAPPLWVCAQAWATIFDLLERIENLALAYPGHTAREVIRDIPERVWSIYPVAERGVAYRSWLSYGDAFLAGAYREEFRCWRPDGRSKLPDTPNYDDLRKVASWPKRIRRRLADM